MPLLQPAALARHAAATVLFNSVIALFLTMLGHDRFLVNLLYAQCIGLGIWAAIDGGRFLLHPGGWPGARAMALLVLAGVPLAYALGSALASGLLGRPLFPDLHGLPRNTLGLLLMSLVAGAGATHYFTSRALLAQARLAQAEAQHQASEARLRLLQAQLEPHMLFNTLANLRALIATDPARATAMLDRLDDYLRATLAASRSDQHPLRAEFARLDDYLALMAVRMGPRLRPALDLPEALADLPVPPLLLQPLVENAIRHGLEGQVDGGELRVSVQQADPDTLSLTVADTGRGCAGEPPSGFGLAQVRERLLTSCGAQARLHWHSEPGVGTTVRITLPMPSTTPDRPTDTPRP